MAGELVLLSSDQETGNASAENRIAFQIQFEFWVFGFSRIRGSDEQRSDGEDEETEKQNVLASL